MNAKDRIAALATLAARVDTVGERLKFTRVPVELLAEITSIRRGLDVVRTDIEREEAKKPS